MLAPTKLPHAAIRPIAGRPLALACWLTAVAALVVAIVTVGGITRLTESGLSITQWKPISGIIPPLTEAQWQGQFELYRAIPQYGAVHAGMSLGDFKAIFFWEYVHRLLGRVIGLAMALPLVWFAWTRAIPGGFAPGGYGRRLIAILALGGVQGVLGWLMVRSGLSDRTEVAPGWLAAHLLTALLTLAALVWTIADLRALARGHATPARLTPLGLAVGGALVVQLLYGALMAGLRAGRVTDQWPLMNGAVFPGPSQTGESLGTMLTADPAIVHFIHRWWAWVVLAMLVVLARRLKRVGARPASVAIHALVGTQILLGIATVMADVALPLAALHQLVGAMLVAACAWGAAEVGRHQA